MISPILPMYERTDLNFSHGTGVYLFTQDGRKYLDLAAGYAANSLGHCHPDMVEALKKQASKFWHLSNRYKIPGLLEYSKSLCDNTFADTVFMANSGAEAVECMIKMARRYFNAKGQKDRYEILTLDGAFHGRTLACATAGSAEKIVGFEPPVQGFKRVAFNSIDALKEAISEKTAGIMVELIQGEGGMRAVSDEYAKELEKICREKGILLMVDEVQSGMGRSGFLFAHEMYGIKPDIAALGKGLGAGFPVSACIATEKVGKAMKQDSHGTTFGGNPLAVAVGQVVLDIIADKTFLENVRRVGDYMHVAFNKLKFNNPDVIDSITGKCMITGIKFNEKIDVNRLNFLLREAGALSMPASGNVLRITPPLIMLEKHVDEAVKKLQIAIDEYQKPASKVRYTAKRALKSVKLSLGIDKQ